SVRTARPRVIAACAAFLLLRSGWVQFRVDLGFALTITDFGVVSTDTTFVPVFATTTENFRSTCGPLIDVVGAPPVTASIRAVRNSCSAIQVLRKVIYSGSVGLSVRPS